MGIVLSGGSSGIFVGQVLVHKENDLPPRAILLVDVPSQPDMEQLTNDDINVVFLPPMVMLKLCEDAIDADINEWMARDGANHGNLTNEYIVAANNQEGKPPDTGSDDKPKGDTEPLVSHADAAATLGLALHYVEQQDSAMSVDVMFMRKWCNKALSSRFSSLRQKRLIYLLTF
ncbi:hypothetical protein PR048_014907 [Dryococelus australis]|uniref:Cytosolic malate dehydrogenase n=1 Tax=Dryococelus australis TaxID=614101 RepID=A0ABQ9HFH5_9NEOP|nr:hypothetical protein PR048_014907 [Dryococelus australis]